jgi:hypothetical protein
MTHNAANAKAVIASSWFPPAAAKFIAVANA